jgi:hypothetical protein
VADGGASMPRAGHKTGGWRCHARAACSRDIGDMAHNELGSRQLCCSGAGVRHATCSLRATASSASLLVSTTHTPSHVLL